jgi:Uma2 family endonuclease
MAAPSLRAYCRLMVHAAPKPWSLDEFLEWERTQEERYEYHAGLIRMMVGGTVDHNIIAGNVFAELRARLRGGPCRAFVENVKVVSAGFAMYPDVVVTCSDAPHRGDVVPEPVVVVEVLSRSTEGGDRGEKWDACRRIPGLAQYVLVSQHKVQVEVFTRQGDRWDYAVVTDPRASATFEPVRLDLALAEIYEGTSLDPYATGAAP